MNNKDIAEMRHTFSLLDRQQQELFFANFKKVLGGKLDVKLFEVKFQRQEEGQTDHTQRLLHEGLHTDDIGEWKAGMQAISCQVTRPSKSKSARKQRIFAISPQDLRYVKQVNYNGKRCLLIKVEEDTKIEGFKLLLEELLEKEKDWGSFSQLSKMEKRKNLIWPATVSLIISKKGHLILSEAGCAIVLAKS